MIFLFSILFPSFLFTHLFFFNYNYNFHILMDFDGNSYLN